MQLIRGGSLYNCFKALVCDELAPALSLSGFLGINVASPQAVPYTVLPTFLWSPPGIFHHLSEDPIEQEFISNDLK